MTDDTQANEVRNATAAPEQSTEVSTLDAPFKMKQIENVAIEPGEGILLRTLPEVIAGSKLMARAGIALPPHARDNEAVCFAIMMQTMDWKLRNPFFTANHSYVVKNKYGVETLAYDSAVYQAVLMASGAIIGRPQYEYAGEGADRRCTVSIIDRQTGNREALTTPTVGNIKTKNSPLWADNPDQQLGYYGLRNLVRLKYQDALGGFYDKDEFIDYGGEVVGDTLRTTNLLERLPGRVNGPGFAPSAGEAEATEQAAIAKAEATRAARVEALKKARAAKAAKSGDKTAPRTPRGSGRGAVEAAKHEGAVGRVRPKPTPTTQAEYLVYAQAQIEQGMGTAWLKSDEQLALQADCDVSGGMQRMLLTLAAEKAKGRK